MHVFSPEDLGSVAGGPKGRRDLLDDALALLDAEGARAADDVERVLRQRGALLRQVGRAPHPGPDVLTTLDVWDQRLADAAKILVAARESLVSALAPGVDAIYGRLAGNQPDSRGDREAPSVAVQYHRSWEGDLQTALTATRADDLRRGVNTVGPHRDDLVVRLDGLPARTHASQGEQRCLALALRLNLHAIVRERTTPASDPAPRRRLLRARPGPQPGARGRAPGRPGHLHDGRSGAVRRDGGFARRGGPTGAAMSTRRR